MAETLLISHFGGWTHVGAWFLDQSTVTMAAWLFGATLIGMDHGDAASLWGKTFTDQTLRGARFVECDLVDVVIRGCDVSGMDIDDPWLWQGGERHCDATSRRPTRRQRR